MTFSEEVDYLVRTEALLKGTTLKVAEARIAKRLGVAPSTVQGWRYRKRDDGFKPRSKTRRGVPVATSVRRSYRRRQKQILTLERGQFVDVSNLFTDLTFDTWQAEGAAAILAGPVPAIAAEAPGGQLVAEVEIDLEELEGVLIDKSSKGLHTTLESAVRSFVKQVDEFFERYSVFGDVVAFRVRRAVFKAMPTYDGQKFQKMEEVSNTL